MSTAKPTTLTVTLKLPSDLTVALPLWPLIVTNDEAMRTLPVGFAIFKGSFREITLWGELLACAVICVIPVICVFLLGRKYFINDLVKGAVKE